LNQYTFIILIYISQQSDIPSCIKYITRLCFIVISIGSLHDKSSACRDLDQKVAAFPYQQIHRKFHQYSRVIVNIISQRVIGNKSACVQIQAEQSITHLRTQRNYLNRFYKAQKLWQTSHRYPNSV